MGYVDEIVAENALLKAQIGRLTDVLTEKFGGPVGDESACEMATRLLLSYREAEEKPKAP